MQTIVNSSRNRINFFFVNDSIINQLYVIPFTLNFIRDIYRLVIEKTLSLIPIMEKTDNFSPPGIHNDGTIFLDFINPFFRTNIFITILC